MSRGLRGRTQGAARPAFRMPTLLTIRLANRVVCAPATTNVVMRLAFGIEQAPHSSAAAPSDQALQTTSMTFACGLICIFRQIAQQLEKLFGMADEESH
jgi:hypothetical protein